MQPTKIHSHNFKLREEGVFYISPMVEVGFVSRSSKAKMLGGFLAHLEHRTTPGMLFYWLFYTRVEQKQNQCWGQRPASLRVQTQTKEVRNSNFV